jgi:hypothetical protein
VPWADEVWPNVTHVRTTTTTLRAATEETPLSAVIGVAATAPSLRRTAIMLLGEVALKQNTRGILLSEEDPDEECNSPENPGGKHGPRVGVPGCVRSVPDFSPPQAKIFLRSESCGNFD